MVVFGTPVMPGPVPFVVNNSVLWAVFGFLGGAAFSVVLGIAEGRRRFDEMSLPRFAAWGAAGGLLLSALMLTIIGPTYTGYRVILTSVMTLMAAGSAAGSLALARRADDRELLEDGEDVADVGLTEKETHQLLGT